LENVYGLAKSTKASHLILACLYKVFLFGLVVAAFHILEEVLKRLVLHKQISLRMDEILIRNLVVFSFLVPFFAFWELRRVLGEGRLFE